MNKCKIIKRKGMRKLLVKGIKGQQLSEWETNAINTNEAVGLLHLDAYKKGFAYQLEYDITGYITFQEFLQIPLTQESFARVLDNILENLKSVEEKHLNQQLILYDMDKIYINPSTQRLFFAYVPLQPFENGGTLQKMLLDIIQYSAFDENEDTDYVSEYISILNRGINFSTFDLGEYVQNLIKIVNGEYMGETVECPRCHAIIPAKTVLCKCGQKLHGLTGSTNTAKSQVYDMFRNHDLIEQPEQSRDNGLSDQKGPTLIKKAENTTGIISQGMPSKKNATTVLAIYDEEEQPQASLLRDSNGEKVPLRRYPFRIGRESGDYIASNRYISEPHLDILYRDRCYYVVDLGSTNGTYVDGVAISAGEETEVFSGCRLKLANEQFQFIIE